MSKNHLEKSQIKSEISENQQKEGKYSSHRILVFKNENEDEKTEENELMRAFCNRWCQAKKKPEENFFSKEELIKMKQKRPKIQPIYKMRSLNSSEFDNAMKDLKEISELIDQL